VREGRDVDDLVGAADLVIIDAKPHAEAYVRITARAARLVAVPVQPSPLRSVGDRQVRSGLPAGGRWIRTFGIPIEETTFFGLVPFVRRNSPSATETGSFSGTDGSNPSSSSGESGTNPVLRARFECRPRLMGSFVIGCAC
jgi:hypothetical protein